MADTDSTCSIGGCANAIRSRGLCSTHYSNLSRYGYAIPRRDWSIEDTLDDTGWDYPDSGCWEWRGDRNELGYGRLTLTRKGLDKARVHRLMFERYFGPIPLGLIVRHKCDNPPCSNPAHLEPGTHADNMRDMAERGRARNAYSLGVVRYGTTTDGKVATKCRKRGHDITAEDALIRFDDGKVKCRACLPLDHAASRVKRFKTRRTRLGS